MSTEKTNLSSVNVPDSTFTRAVSQRLHAALRHFYGQDEDKCDQRKGGQAYTLKTLRYLLPMLRNRAQAILYVHGEEKNVIFKNVLHGLCLLSKALGRPAVCIVTDKDASNSVQVVFIFAQHCVVIGVSPNAAFDTIDTRLDAAIRKLQQENVLQKVQYAKPLLSIALDPKNSAVVLIEWLSRLLRRSLSVLLAGFQQMEQTSSGVACSVKMLDPKSFQFLEKFKASFLAKFRSTHASLLMDVPEKAVSNEQATSEEAFVQQCYEAIPQRLLPRLHNFIESTESFVVRSKLLRDLLWDEKEDQAIQEFKALSAQLRGNKAPVLLVSSAIQQLQFLAEGNFGRVYEGLWSKTPIAVKVLKQDAQFGIQEEFKNEAALMSQMDHPRIVRCYGLCLTPLQAVFELMKGGSLENHLRVNQVPKEPFFDLSIRMQMLLDMGEAIHHLHSHQIVHGDLRTPNFLVDENNRVKLGDFGLAKQRFGMMTVAFTNTRSLGKLGWLAPELLSKEGERTFATDVYSFGMVIWELFTGYEPFGSQKSLSENTVIEIIKKGEVLQYHSLPSNTPTWIVTIFEACLQLNSASRPAMGEILQVLLLAINPQRYLKLYDPKSRVASPWLQDILLSVQSILEVAAVINAPEEGVADSDSEKEVPGSDKESNVDSASSAADSPVVSTAIPTASPFFKRSLPAIPVTPKTEFQSSPTPSVKPPESQPSISPTKMKTSTPEFSRTNTSVESGVIPNHLIQVDLTKKLGSGGFGAVYQGKYRGLRVAIKELLVQDFSQKAHQEFERESKTMLQLHDTSVVHLYGVTNEKPYRMVLEFCELGSLDRYLQKRAVEEVSWTLRFHFAIGIVSGLHYLHTYNPIIIHGDLKSLNVLLTGNPESPTVKIGDFGMAQLKNEVQSQSKSTEGSKGLTLQWAAPELFSATKGKKTIASDMYAYGVTLWEIATHQYPYANCNIPEVIRMSVEKGEREEVPQGTPPLFKDVMTACWSQSPSDRPSTETVLHQLQTYDASAETSSMEKSDTTTVGSGVMQSSGSISSSKSSSPVDSGAVKSSSSDASSQGSVSYGSKPVVPSPVASPAVVKRPLRFLPSTLEASTTTVPGKAETGYGNASSPAPYNASAAYPYFAGAANNAYGNVSPPISQPYIAPANYPVYPTTSTSTGGYGNLSSVVSPYNSSVNYPYVTGMPNIYGTPPTPQPYSNPAGYPYSSGVAHANVASPATANSPYPAAATGYSYTPVFHQPPTQQQAKQEELVRCASQGKLSDVQRLEFEGASFLYPDKNGVFPLVAAIYSTNFTLVSYIEGKLSTDEAAKQWAQVD